MGRVLFLRGCAAVAASALVACSAGPSSSFENNPPPTQPPSPSPALLQYTGEYDDPSGAVSQLALHVDGSFDATVDGAAAHGTYTGGSKATARLDAKDGRTFTLAFRAEHTGGEVPARALVDLTSGDGTRRTLVAPWLAGNEGFCDATHGTWRYEDAELPDTVACTCATGDLYLPSRGGCIAPRTSGDPPRLPVSDAARHAAGIFDGTGRVASIILATDGRWLATVDGGKEEGTWWDAELLGFDEGDLTIACVSAGHAFGAAFESDGSLSVSWGGGRTESPNRRPE